MLKKIEHLFNLFHRGLGNLCAILLILMMLNVFLDVILRYFFSTGSMALQEMEWHLFSIVFLLGIAYTLDQDAHVRVDIIYEHLSPQKRAYINIIGTLIFIFPFALLITTGSFDFVREAYQLQEISGDPGGLTHRYLIKTLIPLSFLLLMISSIGFIVKNIRILITEASL